MSQAAYIKKVSISDDAGSTWYELPMNNAQLRLAGDVLDDTNMETNAGQHTKLIGLLDWSVAGQAEYTAGHTGLGKVRTAFLARATILLRYLPDGTVPNGYQGSVQVENYTQGGEVAGKEAVEVSFIPRSALAAAS